MIERIKESPSGPGSHPEAPKLYPAPNPALNRDHDIIRVTEPVLGDSELAAVLESMRSGFISSAGSAVGQFEEKLAAQCRTKHALATSCGTHALDLLMYALDLKPGDEVIVPSMRSSKSASVRSKCFNVCLLEKFT